ncbi:MAG: hypothetical protein HKN33_01320 [Pyrinomonadaceae bacterium]|nr:hypothetical protein [Pyrinomonadaceae bacterium]
MSKAATSVFVFSLYMFVLGLVLLIVPNMLLRIFAIPDTSEVWIRVVGMLVLILGAYYFQAARNELVEFFKVCVLGRFSVLIFLTAFVLLGFAPATLILFGVIDAAAASWTALALRSDVV